MPSFRSYPTVGISRVLFATAASLFLSSSAVAAQTVEIKLSANETLNAIIGNEDSIYFEPYSPAPTEPTSCSEECPCMFPGDEVCGCDLETVCGGTIPLDLSVGNTLEFRWDASMNGDKLLAINGTERTRVEFRAHIEDCEMPYQEITGDMIAFELDDAGLDATQKYTYNSDNSFLDLGTCDGCAKECDIYTRLQFDPDENGVLNMKFKSLKFSVSYDPQKVSQGEMPYKWATDSYIWIRKPEGGDIGLMPAPMPLPTSAAPTAEPSRAPVAAPSPDDTSPGSSSSAAPTPAPVKATVPDSNPPETVSESPTESPTSSGYSAQAALLCMTLSVWCGIILFSV